VTPTASRRPSPSAPSTARARPSHSNSSCRWPCPCPTTTSTSLIKRRLFRALIEKADQELVLQWRHGKGGGGIQRRGTRPFTFKTTFGEVTVQRSRIRHNDDDSMEIPSATAWNTPHQLAITQNLRDAVCDQMSDQSAGKSRADVCQDAGDEGLLAYVAQFVADFAINNPSCPRKTPGIRSGNPRKPRVVKT
jgi:hypothetical protein